MQATKLLSTVGLKENPHTVIKDIGVGKQQLVEIAKALSKNVKLLILDEPTAALNEEDSNNLLRLMLELKKEGITSILISHKLNEVLKVADSITVLRDGATIETYVTEDRKTAGLVLMDDIKRNITLAKLDKISKIFINDNMEIQVAEEYRKKLNIKPLIFYRKPVIYQVEISKNRKNQRSFET